ncbi:sarcosine oxidase / L-pipecolate oxidase, partial [Tremellales sp. Uapishka_1]
MGNSSSALNASRDTASLDDLSHDSKIVIVGGGGTMGSSTALHLARRGYKDITILDVYPIPSDNSAGNDLNKIAGGGFRDTPIGELFPQIINGWKNDPVFKPYYHATGRVTGASTPEQVAGLKRAYEKAIEHGMGDLYEWLETEEDIVRRAPHLAGTTIQGWKGLWSSDSGWVAARDAIDSVGRELVKLGVKMAFGPAGTFKEPILSKDRKTCVGVLTEDGTRYMADRVVLATGAWSPSLVDLQGQCVSKCWVIGHLQLTDEEAERYKGIPVVYHETYGFFFEPHKVTKIMKLCNEFPGYTRYTKIRPFGGQETNLSVPRSHAAHPSDTMPTEGMDDIYRLIATLLPDLVGRELIDNRMCWCTDMPDGQWLFCPDPRWKNLYLATGDSGKSFHTIPFVGSVIADMLEGKLTEKQKTAWGWRPEKGDPDHIGRGGPEPKDLSEVPGWAHGDPEDQL